MIIGLVGFKQVGKSTAAKYLEEKYGFGRKNMKDALVKEIKDNFPDLLEEMLKVYEVADRDNNFNYIDSIDELFEHKPALMRALMQNYGTEVRRGDMENYWCHRWYENVNELKEKFVVVDDVRFENEAFYVRKFMSRIIRLERPDIETGGEHRSETEQLKIPADYTIVCDKGDHEKLYRELDKIYEELT